MHYREHVTVVASAAAQMVGIVGRPLPGVPQHSTGVVMVVGGAQYRAGSHRFFVTLARTLAAAGYPVLRFDFPGMGDSLGSMASFEDAAPHIAAAIQALLDGAPQTQRVTLLGLCDGASASLLYLQATQDARVSGIAMLNPWVRTEAGLARTHVKHYYRDRLLQPAFWHKLLHGKVGRQALRGLVQNVHGMHQSPTQHPDFVAQMAHGLQFFSGSVLVLLSECDLTAAEFLELTHLRPTWATLLDSPQVQRYDIRDADHTFSSLQAQQEVARLSLRWLEQMHKA